MESLNRSNKHRCDRAYEYKLPKQLELGLRLAFGSVRVGLLPVCMVVRYSTI